MEASHLQERVYRCPSEAFVVPCGRPELGQEWSSANRVSLQLSVCKGDFAFQWIETWSLEELKVLFRIS